MGAVLGSGVLVEVFGTGFGLFCVKGAGSGLNATQFLCGLGLGSVVNGSVLGLGLRGSVPGLGLGLFECFPGLGLRVNGLGLGLNDFFWLRLRLT